MRRLTGLFLVALLLGLSGWGHQGPRVKIGLLLDHTQDREFLLQKLKDSFQDENADLLVCDSKNDPVIQHTQAEDLIHHGVQALVLLPCSPSKAAPIIKEAHQAGLKVVSLETAIPDSGLDYLIAFNPEKAGEIQAHAMLGPAPKGRYFLADGNPTNEYSRQFREGQLKALQPSIKRGEIEITQSPKDPKVSAVLSSSSIPPEFYAMQIALTPHETLYYAGVGSDLLTCRRIALGNQLMTVYLPPQKLAEETAYLAAKLARKAKQFDCQFEPFPNGSETVQAVFLTPMLVFRYELNTVIFKDGVQKKEEVYKGTLLDDKGFQKNF